VPGVFFVCDAFAWVGDGDPSEDAGLAEWPDEDGEEEEEEEEEAVVGLGEDGEVSADSLRLLNCERTGLRPVEVSSSLAGVKYGLTVNCSEPRSSELIAVRERVGQGVGPCALADSASSPVVLWSGLGVLLCISL